MKTTLAITSVLFFLALAGIAQRAQIVGAAEIVRIDAKKKTLQVRNVAEGTSSAPRSGRRGGDGFPRGGGGQRGGTGRFPGSGYPGSGYPGGGGQSPDGDGRFPGGSSGNRVTEYKVFITKDTVLKLEDMEIEFTDFHVGDRVIVSGYPKGGGGDLEATSVRRNVLQSQ